MDLNKNSSDLELGRRPELKSDEFFVSTKEVIEIISILGRDREEIVTSKGVHLLGFGVMLVCTLTWGP